MSEKGEITKEDLLGKENGKRQTIENLENWESRRLRTEVDAELEDRGIRWLRKQTIVENGRMIEWECGKLKTDD